jgi:hypothetical protein
MQAPKAFRVISDIGARDDKRSSHLPTGCQVRLALRQQMRSVVLTNVIGRHPAARVRSEYRRGRGDKARDLGYREGVDPIQRGSFIQLIIRASAKDRLERTAVRALG